MDVPHYFNVPDGELRRPDSICDPGPQRCRFADTCSNPAFSATWCNKSAAQENAA
jgi:autoinducer 2-degrading protein